MPVTIKSDRRFTASRGTMQRLIEQSRTLNFFHYVFKRREMKRLRNTIISPTMKVISVGTLTKILVNNLPHPPSPQARLSFEDQTHIYTKKLLTYICQHCIGGGGGGRGNNNQIVPLKITIVVLNYSLVIFWTVFTSVPTIFDRHCRCTLVCGACKEWPI